MSILIKFDVVNGESNSDLKVEGSTVEEITQAMHVVSTTLTLLAKMILEKEYGVSITDGGQHVKE